MGKSNIKRGEQLKQQKKKKNRNIRKYANRDLNRFSASSRDLILKKALGDSYVTKKEIEQKAKDAGLSVEEYMQIPTKG